MDKTQKRLILSGLICFFLFLCVTILVLVNAKNYDERLFVTINIDYSNTILDTIMPSLTHMGDLFVIIVIIVILLVAIIVSIQNTEQVETKFLLLTITMPRVLMLLLTFALGLVGGMISASIILKKDKKPEKQTSRH